MIPDDVTLIAILAFATGFATALILVLALIMARMLNGYQPDSTTGAGDQP